jgi:S1-C subfamily serine protease
MDSYKTRLVLLPVVLLVLVIGITGSTNAGERGWLGVVLQPLTEDLKEAMDIDEDLRGVLISEVIDGSPADESGLDDGDIIIEIDGKETRTVSIVTRAIKNFEPGDKVKIVILRDGKKRVITATLGEREEQDYEVHIPKLEKIFKKSWVSTGGYLGVRVEDISSDLGDYFGVDENEGVLVMDVVEDSPAEEAGIKAGDVILEVAGKEVKSSDKLVKYIRDHEPGEEVELLIKRKRRTQKVEAELGKAPGISKSFMRQVEIPEALRYKIHKSDPEDFDYEIHRVYPDELREDLEKLREDLEELRKELRELRDR